MNKAQVYFTKVGKFLAIALLALPAFLFVFVSSSNAAAGINKTINFQGKVVNKTAGTNVSDGTYTMIFKIYDKASGGTQLWTETDSVSVTDGIFRVALGSGTAFPASMNWNQDGLFLDITFNGEAMGTRVQLTAVPYALNAGQVAGLTVQDSTSGAASTSAILKLGDATTSKTFDLGTNNLTFTTSGTTTLTLPTSGTLCSTASVCTGYAPLASPTFTGTVTLTGTTITGAPTWSSNQAITLSTASQPNITSLGTLTGLTMGGTLAMGSNSLTSSGTIGSAASTNFTGLNITMTGSLTANGSTGSGLCLTGGATASWGSCGSGGGGTAWFTTGSDGKEITPINQTLDFTYGSTSTAAALFSFTGMTDLNHQTQASISGRLVVLPNNGYTNVGIGTATPNSLLHISDYDNTRSYQLTIGYDSSREYRIGRNNVNGYFDFTGVQSSFSGYRFFYNTSTLAMMIQASTGNIGLGTSSPISELHLTRPLAQGATGKALAIFDQIENQDILTASKAGVTKFILDQNGNASQSGSLVMAGANSLQTTTFNTLTLGGSSTGNIIIAPWNGAANSTLQIKAANTFLGINGSLNGSLSFYSAGASITPPTISTDSSGNLNLSATQAGASVVLGSGVGDIVIDPGTYKIGVGISSSIISQLHVTRALSNGATGKALAIFDQIENQDIFTASKSGVTKFIIGKNGEIGLGLSGGVQNFGSNGNCLQSGGTGASASWASCGGGGGGGAFQINSSNGTITALNNTADLLIGGTSTSSAVFAFTGINNASIPELIANGSIRIGARTNSTTDWARKNSAAGTFQTTTAIDKVTASVIYNGSLYVGTTEANKAEVYRYNGDGTWTALNSTAGTFNTTASIDGVTAMTVFNGYLYIGTSETDKAEVYRYDGGTTWTQINVTGTAGKFLTTTAIDTVSAIAVHLGNLYIGTQDATALAQVYRYDGGTTWAVLNATAGTFLSVSAVDGVGSMISYQGNLYIGTIEANKAQVLRYDGGQSWVIVNTGTTTPTFDSIGTIDGITSMAVYNGSLYAGINEAGLARVFRYDKGLTTVTNWKTVTGGTGGTMGVNLAGSANTTTAIDRISGMAVYNGNLYVSTSKSNSGEIYKYEGGANTWTKASGTGALPSSSPPTSSIDEIDNIQVYGNDLWAFTAETDKAEAYIYTSYEGQSFALKFNAASDNANAEQNGLLNEARIQFVAEEQAYNYPGIQNTGRFIFSHGINTAFGAYDVAEDYPTRDDTLEQGDLVSIDPNESTFIRKTQIKNDNTVIGVYSTNPALRLSQTDATINGGRAVPVALAGRVPIKVNTESGEIKPGDFLTSSSIPGVAMRAKGNVYIIAQAMEGYSGGGVGKVMSFIKPGNHQATIADSFSNINLNSSTLGQDILDQLAQEPPTGTSDTVTDRMIANIEIVSPKITVDTLFAKKIVAGQIDGLDLISDRLAKLESQVATLSATLNTASQASSESALLAKQNELIDRITKDLDNASGSATVPSGGIAIGNLDSSGLTILPAGVRVKGNGLFEGILTVLDTLTTNNFIVNGTSTFFRDVIAKAKVTFEGPVTFSSDAGGFATIVKGTDRVSITFDQEFGQSPLVNTSISFDEQKDQQGNIVDSASLEQAYFKAGYRYVIVNKSTKGFTIVLNKKATDDLNFTWTALRVKDAKTIQSRLPE